MKSIFIPIVTAILLLFTACNKSGSGTPANTYGYTVSGLQDITIRQYTDTTFTLPIAVNYVSGSQETVTVSVSDLPPGLSAGSSTATGIPTFSPAFTISGRANQTGTYTVKLTVNSPSSGSQTFTFKITVAANPGGCTANFFGIYQTHYSCGTLQASESNLVSNAPGKIFMQGLTIEPEFYMLTTVTANVNCDDKTFICDSMNFSGSLNLTFYGYGDINGDSITVHYHGVHEGNPYNCTAVYRK